MVARMASTAHPTGESFQRALWRRVETIHAVTYFGQESRDAATEAGLRGFWMGYFGFRASPLGEATAAEVERVFFNFAPGFVARSVPDVWSYARPSDLVRARAAGAAATLRRLSPHAEATMHDIEPWVSHIAEAGRSVGEVERPLFAANRALEMPDDPVERLWQYTTIIREHRGDGHVATLVAAGLDGCEALALISAHEAIPAQRFRESRGWTDEEWAAAEERLVARHLLDAPGVISAAGLDLRADVETSTDRLAEDITAAMSSAERASLVRRLDQLSFDVITSGLIPFPNPIGLPDPRR